jgi:hypothetical protein
MHNRSRTRYLATAALPPLEDRLLLQCWLRVCTQNFQDKLSISPTASDASFL